MLQETRTMRIRKALGVLALGAAVFGGIANMALAHHSAAMFDANKLVVLRGTIRSFSFLNPHAWISVDGAVDGKGEVTRWDVEATSPSQLKQSGITESTLKPGDKVTVGVRPWRDGRHGGGFVFVVTTDGKNYGADPGQLDLSLEELKPQ
jgi:hypothetical protein